MNDLNFQSASEPSALRVETGAKRRFGMRWLVLLVATVAIAATTVLLFAQPTRQPRITWSENQLEVILSPGETTTQDLTFTSTLSVENIVIEPVPELAPFVTVQPSSFANVPANQPQSVRLTFSIPSNATLGTYDGTVHVRSGSQTLPQTLKVKVRAWNAFSAAGQPIILRYPEGLTLTEYALADNTQTFEFSGGSPGYGFTLEIVPSTPSGLAILAWADEQEWPFPDDWRNHYVSVPINELQTLQDRLTHSIIFLHGNRVYFVTNGVGQDPVPLDDITFDGILDSIRVSQ